MDIIRVMYNGDKYMQWAKPAYCIMQEHKEKTEHKHKNSQTYREKFPQYRIGTPLASRAIKYNIIHMYLHESRVLHTRNTIHIINTCNYKKLLKSKEYT